MSSVHNLCKFRRLIAELARANKCTRRLCQRLDVTAWTTAGEFPRASHCRALGLGPAQVLVEPGHDLDEVAGAIAIIELVPQDLVPGVAAGARRARKAEDVSPDGHPR